MCLARAGRGVIEERTRANERFFAAEAERIAAVSREVAERFRRGGTLIATGATPQDWSDARRVAVEFVHPVIVGKRALPAVALPPEQLPLLASREDTVITFSAGPLTVGGGASTRRRRTRSSGRS